MDLSLISIFGAGMLTLVTPCILPMLPIYFALLMGAGLESARTTGARFRLLVVTTLFFAGFSAVFTLLGLGASSIGGVLQSHRRELLLLGGVLIVLFGLKFLGVVKWEFLQHTLQLKGFKTGSKGLDAFVFGVVFALGWTPCVGPILGSVLTYTAATTSSAWAGALYLFTYSLGVGLPLLVISLAADRFLPKLRRLQSSLPTFERVTGGIMVAIGLFLVVPEAISWAHAPKSPEVAFQDDHSPIAPPIGRSSQRPRLVEFYRDDCPNCKEMAPIIKRLREDCVNQSVEILTVNISDPANARLADRLGVRGVPTVKLYDPTGRESAQLLGLRELEELRAAAAGLIAASCAGVMAQTDFSEAETKPTCGTDLSGVASESAEGECSLAE